MAVRRGLGAARLGYTFYTGAVDAWMVDALQSVGYEGRLEPIFARYGIVFGIFMLIGTTLGGFLGQVDLWIPYVLRAVVLVPAFLLGLLVMRDLGFKARALTLGSFGRETRRIAREGVTYGLSDRVVRFIMFASLVQGVFFMYGFYSWQKYFLDLLGSELVWVTGVIAALVGLTQIFGNMLVGRIMARWSDRGLILMVCSGVTTVTIIGAALIQNFWVAVPLYLVSTIAFGISLPVKQGWLNARIPSKQRATIISLDALFGDAGSTVGQVGLGWFSQTISIPFAWLVGGLVQGVSVPLLGVARKAEKANPADKLVGMRAGEQALTTETPGCFGPEPAATCVPGDEPAASGGERVA